MMRSLMIKDMRAFGKSILIIAVLSLIVNTLFSFFNERSWFIYIVMSAGQISFIIGYYLMSEKMRRGEMLLCSLSISRPTIIRGKYLVASLIAIVGMILWFLNACLLNSIFIDTPGDFHLFTNPIVIFFILFYFSFFISIFFPIVTIFDKIWALTNLSILFAVIFIVPFSLYYEARGLLIAEFKAGNIFIITLLTAIMIILLWLSIIISTKLFKRREL